MLVAAFVAWELRAPHPMLPMRFFRSRTFAAANGVGFVMSFGVFGSIFLLAPFLQVTQGLSPLEAGIRTLPWTAMPMLVAPWAGILSDRIGSRPLMATGLALQAGALAWLAAISTPDVAYASLVLPFAMAGAGMALVFAPVGQRGARLGRPALGRPGLGRDQRDPRARRRDGHRGARERVQRPRLLRVAAGLHRRHGQRGLGRRRGARRGRAGRAADPAGRGRGVAPATAPAAVQAAREPVAA